jgi:hypothetical protein
MSSDGSGSQPDTPWSSPSGDQGSGSSGEPTLPPPSQPYPASPSGSPYQPPAHPQPEPPYQEPYQQGYQQPYQQPYPPQPTSPYQQPYQPYAASPYGGQPYGAPYGGVFSKPNGKANTAMGLGIASLACAVLTLVCCITIPGVLCGPFAIGLAISAKKEMDAQPGVFNNPGAAQAGLITGIIGTVLGALMIVLVVAFFGFAISADSMS